MPALEGAGARVSGWVPGVPRAIRPARELAAVGGRDQLRPGEARVGVASAAPEARDAVGAASG
jgi:hypothetical protein